jgi:pimeloyl-ACP methyl ester carboxylesterase
VTSAYVRFNTGRHISENGRSLADLLDELVAEWPVEVEEIALVGHSLGGLVARSACAAGGSWTSLVRHTVTLGTPHTGAPLESAVHYAAAVLGVVGETRPFARFLRRRSAGIRDLRSGSVVDEDWRDRDPEALRAAACAEVPLLEGAAHHFVAATVTTSAEHPLGRLVGDWLVLQPSASGRSRTRVIGFAAEDGAHVGGTHHLALLNHPVVYERLRDWLGRAPRSGQPATARRPRARAS